MRTRPGDAGLVDIGDVASEPDKQEIRVSCDEPPRGTAIDDVGFFDRTRNELAKLLDGDPKSRSQSDDWIVCRQGHVAASRGLSGCATGSLRRRCAGSCHTRCVAWADVGTMIAASCPCGYENDELAVGGGMLTFMEHCAAPALCTSCHEVVTIDLMDRDATCPNCDGPPTPYDDPSLRGAVAAAGGAAVAWNLPDGRSFELDHEGAYTCPRCLQTTLSFVDVGSFD